ncbi:hypothetical protein CHS0354_000219 [Potamilus streckersoni]|uniref:Uncharacterized protein n=1 Tax=Potamilus streckersoni TaxID=2493646 RepID=A0AAE0SHT8_9BIVA|nr:hypothetical protein CHS0354_000219 [Potamilus streckersoni]
MMQYYVIVSMNLKAVCKNQRSVIILDRLKDFDSGILVLENWLEGVKVITSATRYYYELLNKAMETELTLDKLLSNYVTKRTICIIKEGKVSIYEDDIFDYYERAIRREFSSYVELKVLGNKLKTGGCKMYVEHLSRTWKDKIDVLGSRPVEWNSNKDLVIKSTKNLDLVQGLMMNEDHERAVNHSLDYCIANLVQPDGTSRADISSLGSGTRYPTVDETIPNSHSSSHENTQLENSWETEPQINLQTDHYSLQMSLSSDSGSSVHVEPIANQNSSNVRVRPLSRGNDINSNVLLLNEGSNRESTQRPQHPLFQEYIKRVASYATFRQFALFDTDALARAGFYNTAT